MYFVQLLLNFNSISAQLCQKRCFLTRSLNSMLLNASLKFFNPVLVVMMMMMMMMMSWSYWVWCV